MSFSDEKVQKVWEKAQVAPPNDQNTYRKDQCGAWINRGAYGDRNSKYGWEVDHINPNGGDDLTNLRPLHWKNNLDKGEGKLKCPVTSEGDHNIEK